MSLVYMVKYELPDFNLIDKSGSFEWFKAIISKLEDADRFEAVAGGKKYSGKCSEEFKDGFVVGDGSGRLKYDELELFSGDNKVLSLSENGKYICVYGRTKQQSDALTQISRDYNIFFRADLYAASKDEN